MWIHIRESACVSASINNLYLYIKEIPLFNYSKKISYFILRLIFSFISLFWVLRHFLLFKNIWNNWRSGFELKEMVYFENQLLKEMECMFKL